MSWRNPSRCGRTAGLALVLALAPALSGCGFHPLYGTHANGGSAAAGLRTVQIDLIADRNGQILRNALLDRFYGDGGPAEARYRLTVTEHASEELLGIQRDNSATKARMDVVAYYTLLPSGLAGATAGPGAKPPKPLASGTAQSRVLYDINDDQYAALVGKQNAYRQGAEDVADQITEAIAAHLDGTMDATAAAQPGSGG